jgi:hypothetical protein
MTADIGPIVDVHFQFLSLHPWIESVAIGALMGLIGAGFYIGSSSLFRTLSERLRTRRALALLIRLNDEQLEEDKNMANRHSSMPAEIKNKN